MVTINKNLVNASKYSIKCPYAMTPEWITIHNTYNDASAANEIQYMITNNNEVSFHFAVDDVNIVQGIPLDRNAWHAGDGGSGTGNRKSIAIEICYSKSGGTKFDKSEANAAKLAAQLLFERKWGVSKLKRHKDWSNKDCPHRTIANGWDRFVKMVQTELDTLNNPPKAGTQTFYRVVAGSYLDKSTANNVKAKLEKAGYTGIWIDVITK